MPTHEPLTPTQLEILQAVWELGPDGGTAPAIWQQAQKVRELARTTVLTQVQRLHKKGWLKRRERGGAVVFRAVCDRATAEGRLARRFLADFFAGSAAGFVKSLLGDGRIDKKELERLRAAIDDAEQQR
jgi:predicted transcriptional regulator